MVKRVYVEKKEEFAVKAGELREEIKGYLGIKGIDKFRYLIRYDIENLKDPDRAKSYTGEIAVDYYGRVVPKHAHGTANLSSFTNSTTIMVEKMVELFDRITDPALLVRRMYVVAGRVLYESEVKRRSAEYDQLSFFDKNGQFVADMNGEAKEDEADERERAIQDAVLKIKKRYGKNAILKGTSYTEGATARERNAQIGGHKA